MKVINFGSLNIDYVYQVDHFLQPGETCASLDFQICSGGKGLNQSVALAKAGQRTYHAGFVGGDGEFLVKLLEEKGVSTEYIRVREERTGHAIIQVDRTGQNCILLYPGTNRRFSEEYIDEVLEGAEPQDVVLVQNETNLVGEIIEQAWNKGLRVAMNAAPMGKEVFSYPLEKLSWLLVNEIEGGMLSGAEDYDEIARILRERLPGTEIVLTLGSSGAIVSGPEGVCRCGACRVEPVDTTAAGDTFTGFYLDGRIRGEDMETAMKRATVASAMAVLRPGAAASIPSAEEVRESAIKAP